MRTRPFLAVGIAATLLAAGCTSDPKTSSSSSTAAPTSTTTPTPTLSEEEQAATNAEAAYREWLRVRTSCLADPANTVSSCFDKVAIGVQLDSDYVSLAHYQQMGAHVVGEIKTVSVELVSVDLTDRVDRPADPSQDIPEVRTVPTVVFDVCEDRGGYDLVNAAGESQLPSGYTRYLRTLVEVSNYGYPDPSQWRVRNADKNAETSTCEP